jgi:predicted transcriptional regulator
MNEYTKNETVKNIYDFISNHPGLHLRMIAEMLDRNISDVERELLYLERQGVILVVKKDGYDRYYVEKRKNRLRDERTIETRKQILDVITKNPGLYLSKIAEILELSIQLTDYHLAYLIKNKEITSARDPRGHYKRYYLVDHGLTRRDKKILEVLRQEIPLKVVLLLLKHHTLQHKEIWEELDILPSGLSYHIAKLVENEIIDVMPHGKEKGYVLKNREEIIRILKEYELLIGLRLSVERFTDMWKDLNLSNVKK